MQCAYFTKFLIICVLFSHCFALFSSTNTHCYHRYCYMCTVPVWAHNLLLNNRQVFFTWIIPLIDNHLQQTSVWHSLSLSPLVLYAVSSVFIFTILKKDLLPVWALFPLLNNRFDDVFSLRFCWARKKEHDEQSEIEKKIQHSLSNFDAPLFIGNAYTHSVHIIYYRFCLYIK